ncbi:MAG: molybdopterin molybdotransferase MoeA [Verrucomicrobiales bacterium]|nr:molybdopterin molybdotransferase MoeA [Verrucomicrobiales bacterium]
MTPLEVAQDAILHALKPLPTESVALDEACGRITACDIHAPTDLPSFDSSAFDGYAVRADDTISASQESPATLDLLGSIMAGDAPDLVVTPGCGARIFTGAVLPAGADAIVMQEDARIDAQARLVVTEPVTPWEGVRLAGGDVRRGATLIGAGERIKPTHIGLLAAAGIASLQVHRRPRLTFLSTGDELTEPGIALAPGRIYDSNRPLLHALASREGIPVWHSKRIPDQIELVMAALHEAMRDAEVIITTGGVSVGEADFVKPAISALGGSVEVWRLAMKPGKPFAWGRLQNTCWFGLPGNPVSAFVSWWLLVRPALRHLMGMKKPFGRRLLSRLAEPATNPGDRRHFLRVHLDDQGLTHISGSQASHIQHGLAGANALLDLPPGADWPAGREVFVESLDLD